MNEYTKIDENTLSVTKPVEVKEETHEYSLDFLKQQEIDIQKQADDFASARQIELDEVRELIIQCENLGIKEKVDLEDETLKEIIK